jgi:hypothetical protein
MILIGISGRAHAGKSTLCREILEAAQKVWPHKIHVELAFARLLKEECASAFGVTRGTFYKDHMKEVPHPQLTFANCTNAKFQGWLAVGGYEVTHHEPLTPRLVMQRWADFKLSDDPQHFIRPVMTSIAQLQGWDQTGVIVVSDARQLAERQALQGRGGLIWKIERPSLAPMRGHGSHRSETEVDSTHYNHLFINEDLKGLKLGVETSVRRLLLDTEWEVGAGLQA